MHYDMEDLIEQANEVQESMSRTYGVPDEVDEADLEAGKLHPSFPHPHIALLRADISLLSLINDRTRCSWRRLC